MHLNAIKSRLTSVHHIVLVQIVHGFQDLAHRLRRVLFRKAAALADAVKQLAAGGQLGDNVELVLRG